ncbi:uncharacterized protein LOC110964897 isoform X2 [Acanthochromis polyacanthus]|uniref:uncharacterized protein LOC110964897 isoform X2 n=1 Tax=Acanthochromis polyacanthus TaxID=80966 RepID=UPI0022347F0C|nr:uncharacterized protein LOC110964897 isoform X2 [Acanthochromis polyacanthus]
MPKRCAYGTCKSDTRYPQSLEGGVDFFPFPKPKTQEERCRVWIEQCGRPHDQLNPSKINKNTYVCSKHFVDGRPTTEFPNPVAALSSFSRREQQGGSRKPRAKRLRCDEQEAEASTLNSTDEASHLSVTETNNGDRLLSTSQRNHTMACLVPCRCPEGVGD